jgi:hypothetical protein
MSVDRLALGRTRGMAVLAGLPKAFLTSVCLAVLAWTFLNDKFTHMPSDRAAFVVGQRLALQL